LIHQRQRKYFLETELRLNQQIAPELYLQVIAISKQDNRLILAGVENIIEYTLKMRQFAQENLFSNLLEVGKLSSDYPSGTLRDRLNQRQGDISDAGVDLITSQMLQAESFTPAEQAYVTNIDTSQADWQKKLLII
jgi:predicted kinase